MEDKQRRRQILRHWSARGKAARRGRRREGDWKGAGAEKHEQRGVARTRWARRRGAAAAYGDWRRKLPRANGYEGEMSGPTCQTRF
jgi:hypothetical protein